jgi:sugar phosphate isomerase/epimerase
MRGAFESGLELAERYGVYLCMESLSKEQTNIVSTCEQARKMVAEIDHPHFRTMVDVCSGSSEEIPVTQLLRDSGEDLFHVHVNDANKRGPGFGQTDFVSVLRTLKELNYQRYVSVEVFDFAPDPRTIAAGSLHYLKGIAAAL